MAATSTFRASFRQARTQRAAEATRRPPRTPIAVHLARALARALPSLAALRTVVLSLAGLGLMSYAAWLWIHPLGYAAGGLSLLAIEYLSSDRRGAG